MYIIDFGFLFVTLVVLYLFYGYMANLDRNREHHKKYWSLSRAKALGVTGRRIEVMLATFLVFMLFGSAAFLQ